MREQHLNEQEKLVKIMRPDLAIDEEFTKQLIEEEQKKILLETIFYSLTALLLTFVAW